MSDIINIFIAIGKAQLIVLIIVYLSYVIETNTPIKLFFDNYQWKKSIRNAEDISNRDSGLYLIIMIIVFIYDIIKKNLQFNFFNFIIWLLVVSVLVKLFFYFHKKYQAVDHNKADDDFT